MNKKRLSVVMAGAMLASSVAPVLAATATEEQKLAVSQRGLLLDALRSKFETLKFEKGSRDEIGKSVFYITVTKKGESKESDTKIDTVASLETALRANDLEDSIVRLYEKEYQKDKYGQITNLAQEAVAGKVDIIDDIDELDEYTKRINSFKDAGNVFIKSAEMVDNDNDKKSETLVVTLNAYEDLSADELKNITIEFKVGSEKLNFSAPLDKNGKELNATKESDVAKYGSFEKAIDYSTEVPVNKPLTGKTLLATVKLVDDGDKDVKDTYLVSDLFDGYMLTKKGVELFELVKNDKENDGIDYEVKSIATANGISTFTIDFKDTEKSGKVVKTVTVRGTDSNDATILQSYFEHKKFTVGELSGTNRFETAVKIAKEQASIKSVALQGHIVLVNGEALVDGLAAAPLAAKFVKDPKTAAPILLTRNNSIPKETLSYLKELVKIQQIQNLGQITVDIVGGEAVVSKEVVETLEGLGFKVARYGGDNREETSLEVFDEAIEENGRDTIYVVGANGEADAMSIAPIASHDGVIIVAKNGGLSKVALRAIEKAKKDVVIVGGENNISAAEEAKLKEITKSNEKTLKRVAGANRKATNAAIIKEFYGEGIDADAVLVAKDNDLVDALTAANLASKLEAPIVLATNKLSDEQLNQVNLKAKEAKALYQIGGGVNPSVMQKLADLLGLPDAASETNPY